MNDDNAVICLWLESGKYRSLVHRHDGGFRAIDEAKGLLANASGLGDLAHRIRHNWFEKYERVCQNCAGTGIIEP